MGRDERSQGYRLIIGRQNQAKARNLCSVKSCTCTLAYVHGPYAQVGGGGGRREAEAKLRGLDASLNTYHEGTCVPRHGRY